VRALLLSLLCLAIAAPDRSALSQDLAAAPLSSAPCPMLAAGLRRTVVRVLDAETVVLDDGRELRLVGALPPRSIDVGAEPGAWGLEASAKEALEQFVRDKTIELAFAGDRADRYGRVLAQVLVDDVGERRWVQGLMLEQGYARAYALSGTRACRAELIARERVARDAGRGLWAEAAYEVRSAGTPEEIAPYRATYQIVEGQVARVRIVRGAIYLNFGRRWQRGFSAVLRSSDRDLLGAFAGDPQALAGHSVRVRGWIEGQRRPSINLSASGLLEVFDQAVPVGGDASLKQ
jgi:micrococcal nuclease